MQSDVICLANEFVISETAYSESVVKKRRIIYINVTRHNKNFESFHYSHSFYIYYIVTIKLRETEYYNTGETKEIDTYLIDKI